MIDKQNTLYDLISVYFAGQERRHYPWSQFQASGAINSSTRPSNAVWVGSNCGQYYILKVLPLSWRTLYFFSDILPTVYVFCLFPTWITANLLSFVFLVYIHLHFPRLDAKHYLYYIYLPSLTMVNIIIIREWFERGANRILEHCAKYTEGNNIKVSSSNGHKQADSSVRYL